MEVDSEQPSKDDRKSLEEHIASLKKENEQLKTRAKVGIHFQDSIRRIELRAINTCNTKAIGTGK
jgi:hypothetical protein